MLMYTTEGTTIVKQQEKVTNKTLQQMNIISHLRQAFFIFTLSAGQAKLSQANFYSIHFLKVLHFPGKINNIPLPGVFLEASLRLQ